MKKKSTEPITVHFIITKKGIFSLIKQNYLILIGNYLYMRWNIW